MRRIPPPHTLFSLMRRLLPGLFSISIAAAAPLPAKPASVETAIAAVRRDTAQATLELDALHNELMTARREAAIELDQLRQETAKLRAQADMLTTIRQQLDAEHRRLQQGNRYRQELINFLNDLILEARQSFTTRITASGAALAANDLAKVDSVLQAETAADKLAALKPLLDIMLAHCQSQIGGRRYTGDVVTEEGAIISGRIAQLGPLCYFAAGSDPGQTAGLAVQGSQGLLPTLFSRITDKDAEQIRQLVFNHSGTVPVDPSLGAAIKLQLQQETLWQHLRKGRAVMVPLLILALVCACLAVYKLAQTMTLAASPAPDEMSRIVAAVRAESMTEAQILAAKLPEPLQPVITEGIRHVHVAKEHLEEVMHEQLILQAPRLERFLAPLAVCASAAPLLGLLGTVTGMIHTFRLITVFGTGDAQMLSGGISEALITTEVGLVIAVPALLIHAYLSRRVRRAIAVTQHAAIAFVNGVKVKTDDTGDY